MQHIDEQRLEEDIEYRFQYLADFIGFGPDDIKAVQKSAMYIAPAINDFVEATYEKLLSFDATARHFVVRGKDFDGEVADSLDALSGSQEQIKFRKEHLRTYLMQILGRPYDAKMVKYLDTVAKMHTAKGGSAKINVPAIQMNAFMGMLSELFSQRITSLDIDRDEALAMVRAFHKLLWIQNDFINRQYQK